MSAVTNIMLQMEKKVNDQHERIQALEHALKEAVDALNNLMNRFDDGTILRDISRDLEKDFHLRMLRFVSELAQAKSALESARRVLP